MKWTIAKKSALSRTPLHAFSEKVQRECTDAEYGKTRRLGNAKLRFFADTVKRASIPRCLKRVFKNSILMKLCQCIERNIELKRTAARLVRNLRDNGTAWHLWVANPNIWCGQIEFTPTDNLIHIKWGQITVDAKLERIDLPSLFVRPQQVRRVSLKANQEPHVVRFGAIHDSMAREVNVAGISRRCEQEQTVCEERAKHAFIIAGSLGLIHDCV
jgi:hypothetical protein